MLFSLNTGFSTASSANGQEVPETSIMWRPQSKTEIERMSGCRTRFEGYYKKSGNEISLSEGVWTESESANLLYDYENIIGSCVSSFKPQLEIIGDILNMCKNEAACIIRKNSSEQLTLSEVFINGKRVTLDKPLLLNLLFENEHKIVSYDDLGLLAISDSIKQALDEIQEEFSDLWKEYVSCPEDELTEGAKRLRAKLQSVIE